MIRASFAAVFIVASLGACGGANRTAGSSTAVQTTEPSARSASVISSDILAREPLTNVAQVKHILIGWNGLQPHDPRADKRTKEQAEAQVRALLEQIRGGADFDALMKQWSEDPGSAASAKAYRVAPDAQLVIEFRQLGLRLKTDEVGVVESDFGFHIIKRVE